MCDKRDVVINTSYIILRSELTKEDINKINSECVLKPAKKSYSGYWAKPKILYQADKTHVFLPTWYGISTFGLDENVTDERITNDVDMGRWSGHELEEAMRNQITAYTRVKRELDERGGAMMCLPPGDGKTEVALRLAKDIGQKTIFMCHNKVLFSQTIDVIREVLPDVKIGTWREKKCQVDDEYQIVVAMVQTIIKKDKFPKSAYKQFGLMIIDEAHHYNATQFSKILSYYGCRNVLALTGTPETESGSHLVLKLHIGPITIQTRKRYNEIPKVVVANMKCEMVETIKMENGNVDYTNMMTGLIWLNDRNECMANVIKEYVPSGRRCIALTERRDHVQEMARILSELMPEKKISKVVGGTKREARELAKFSDIMISTYALCSEALNDPGLTVVILLTPVKGNRFKQSIMRGMRGLLNVRTILIDFRDAYGVWNGQFYKRRAFYREENYEMEYISIEKTEDEGEKGMDEFLQHLHQSSIKVERLVPDEKDYVPEDDGDVELEGEEEDDEVDYFDELESKKSSKKRKLKEKNDASKSVTDIKPRRKYTKKNVDKVVTKKTTVSITKKVKKTTVTIQKEEEIICPF